MKARNCAKSSAAMRRCVAVNNNAAGVVVRAIKAKPQPIELSPEGEALVIAAAVSMQKAWMHANRQPLPR